MGRWGSKKGGGDALSAAVGAGIAVDKAHCVPHSSCNAFSSDAAASSVSLITEEEHRSLSDNAANFLQHCSLSEEERVRWSMLSRAIWGLMPAPGDSRAGAPVPSVLGALQRARTERDIFIACLGPNQKEDVKQLLDLERRQRKLVSRDEAMRFKARRGAGTVVDETQSGISESKERQKEVMTRAFWLFQQDCQREAGTTSVDSTKWKLIRARGGKDSTLAHYLQRAGWDEAWPLPAPEGRLLRREGQQAALARYSGGCAVGPRSSRC